MIHSICYRVQAQSQRKPMEVGAGAEEALPFPVPAGTPAFMLAATAEDWAAVQAEELNQLINLKKNNPKFIFSEISRDFHQHKCGNGDPDCWNTSMKIQPERGQVIL